MLPVVAAADAPTLESLRPTIAPFLAATGLADVDVVKLATRVKLKRVLDEFAWLDASEARPARD